MFKKFKSKRILHKKNLEWKKGIEQFNEILKNDVVWKDVDLEDFCYVYMDIMYYRGSNGKLPSLEMAREWQKKREDAVEKL
jgi:hypothetical protein